MKNGVKVVCERGVCVCDKLCVREMCVKVLCESCVCER